MRSSEHGSFGVVDAPGCGLGLRALCSISAGTVLLRESPLLRVRTGTEFDEAVKDRVCAGLDDAETLGILHLSSVAEREYAKLAPEQQAKVMSLADAFSPPPGKTLHQRVRA